MRGEENCKFLCADSEADMLKLMAAIIQAKVIVILLLANYVWLDITVNFYACFLQYPDKLQTPLLPVRPPPEQLTPPVSFSLSLSLSLLPLLLSLFMSVYSSYSLEMIIEFLLSKRREILVYTLTLRYKIIEIPCAEK